MNAAALNKFGKQAALTGEALWPGDISFAGDPKTYRAEVKEPKLLGVLEAGGEVEEGELKVKLRKDVYAAKPARDTVLTYREKAWRIEMVEGEEEACAVWTITCEREN
jgi:hypothetical protein